MFLLFLACFIQDAPAKFSTTDPQATLVWLQTIHLPVDAAQMTNNDAALQKSEKQFHRDYAKMMGKPIKWRVGFQGVMPNGMIRFQSVRHESVGMAIESFPVRGQEKIAAQLREGDEVFISGRLGPVKGTFIVTILKPVISIPKDR